MHVMIQPKYPMLRKIYDRMLQTLTALQQSILLSNRDMLPSLCALNENCMCVQVEMKEVTYLDQQVLIDLGQGFFRLSRPWYDFPLGGSILDEITDIFGEMSTMLIAKVVPKPTLLLIFTSVIAQCI
jgi:hypothetical protein